MGFFVLLTAFEEEQRPRLQKSNLCVGCVLNQKLGRRVRSVNADERGDHETKAITQDEC